MKKIDINITKVIEYLHLFSSVHCAFCDPQNLQWDKNNLYVTVNKEEMRLSVRN